MISIIVPVYNSAASIAELVVKLVNAMHSTNAEIILVDDASTDDSLQKIREMQSKFPTVFYYRHERNMGQSAALATGFLHSKGEFIVTIDDDLQYDPQDIIQLLSVAQATDAAVVYGIPGSKNESFFRKIAAMSLKYVAELTLGFENRGSSFRLIKRSVVEQLPIAILQKNILPEVLFKSLELKKAYVSVRHHKRKYGKSNYSFFKLCLLVFNSLKIHLKYLRQKL